MYNHTSTDGSLKSQFWPGCITHVAALENSENLPVMNVNQNNRCTKIMMVNTGAFEELSLADTVCVTHVWQLHSFQ